jgi:pimeloyl-ACP methyl ester carboxylesterase
MIAYPVLRPPRHEIRQIRGLDMHIARWGPESASPVILLHGWQDTADTFQFVIDAFDRDWPLAALDWRGFGRSEWPREGYWFPDYFADLDALLDLLTPDLPGRLVGHSMGGNIACIYAGVRPERVRCLVSLEGFGMARSVSAQAPEQLRRWLGQVKSTPARKTYDSLEQLASVIRFRYPRLGEAEAGFIASAWSTIGVDGRVQLLGDPRHRWGNPTLYKRDDAEACWRLVTAPLLLILGEESDYLARLGVDGTDAAFRLAFPHIDIARVAGVGHMLHLERPDLVAPLIEEFLGAH